MWGWVLLAGVVSWSIGGVMGVTVAARGCQRLLMEECPGALQAGVRTIAMIGRAPSRRTMRRSR